MYIQTHTLLARRMELVQGWKLSLYAHFEIERRNSGDRYCRMSFLSDVWSSIGFHLPFWLQIAFERARIAIVMFICTLQDEHIFSLSLHSLLITTNIQRIRSNPSSAKFFQYIVMLAHFISKKSLFFSVNLKNSTNSNENLLIIHDGLMNTL